MEYILIGGLFMYSIKKSNYARNQIKILSNKLELGEKLKNY